MTARREELVVEPSAVIVLRRRPAANTRVFRC
jgi:hypothetical protein